MGRDRLFEIAFGKVVIEKIVIVESRINSCSKFSRMIQRPFLKSDVIICRAYVHPDHSNIPFARIVYDRSGVHINPIHSCKDTIGKAEVVLRERLTPGPSPPERGGKNN